MVTITRERFIQGAKLAVHLSGSSRAMFLSTPEIGGPFTRTHKHGCPRVLMALQQASLGGMVLKGARAALHGISWTIAEKNVLPQVSPSPFCTTLAVTSRSTNIASVMDWEAFISCSWFWSGFQWSPPKAFFHGNGSLYSVSRKNAPMAYAKSCLSYMVSATSNAQLIYLHRVARHAMGVLVN